jgi:hypothetical protein
MEEKMSAETYRSPQIAGIKTIGDLRRVPLVDIVTLGLDGTNWVGRRIYEGAVDSRDGLPGGRELFKFTSQVFSGVEGIMTAYIPARSLSISQGALGGFILVKRPFFEALFQAESYSFGQQSQETCLSDALSVDSKLLTSVFKGEYYEKKESLIRAGLWREDE